VQTSSPTSLGDQVDDAKDVWHFDSWSPDGTRYARSQAMSGSNTIDVGAFASDGGPGGVVGCGYNTGEYFSGWLPDSRFACATEPTSNTSAGTLLVDDGAGGQYTLTLPFPGDGTYNAEFDSAGDVVYATAYATTDPATQISSYHVVTASTH
jgi:hypothetical protein